MKTDEKKKGQVAFVDFKQKKIIARSEQEYDRMIIKAVIARAAHLFPEEKSC